MHETQLMADFLHCSVIEYSPRNRAIRRRQSMKPPIEVKSMKMNHRPAADCAPRRHRR